MNDFKVTTKFKLGDVVTTKEQPAYASTIAGIIISINIYGTQTQYRLANGQQVDENEIQAAFFN